MYVHGDRVLILDIIVRQRAVVQQHLPAECEELLLRRDAFLVPEHRLHDFETEGRRDLQGDGLATDGIHKDLDAPAVDHP